MVGGGKVRGSRKAALKACAEAVATTLEPDWRGRGDADGDSGDKIALILHGHQMQFFRLPDA